MGARKVPWREVGQLKLIGKGGTEANWRDQGVGVMEGGADEFQRWPRCGWHRWNGRSRSSEIGELDGVCLGVVTTSWMTEPDVAGGGGAGR